MTAMVVRSPEADWDQDECILAGVALRMDLLPEVHACGRCAQDVAGDHDAAEVGIERQVEEDRWKQAQHGEAEGKAEFLVDSLARVAESMAAAMP